MTTLTTEQQILCDLCHATLGSGMEVVSGHKTGYYKMTDDYGHITFSDYAELFLCNTCNDFDPQWVGNYRVCLLYTSPSPRDRQKSRMPSSA